MAITGITIHSDEHERFFKRGILLHFSNGYRMSVIYGTGAYSNTLNGNRHPEKPDASLPEASRVEVAVMRPDDSFVPFADGEDVRGFADFDTVLKIAQWTDGLAAANA